jgi:hypothetical protein
MICCIKDVKRYCSNYTEIENYAEAIADTTQTWSCHHRLETHNSDGERRLVQLTVSELKALGMYYHRPPEELIFLTVKAHHILHKKGKKRGPMSEETKKKLSAANKGRKLGTLSEEAKKKLSAIHKGRSWKIDPTTGKRVWYKNGSTGGYDAVAGKASWQNR